MGAGFEGLGLEIEKGRAFWSEGSSLIISGEEAVGPILGPPLGEGHFGHDDVAGEVLVFRSESVGGPGSEARAGVQVEVSRAVFFIGAVGEKMGLRENGEEVVVETDFRGGDRRSQGELKETILKIRLLGIRGTEPSERLRLVGVVLVLDLGEIIVGLFFL